MNFKDLNTNEYDKNLSPEERAEWNAIYVSYRSGSLLSGNISGIDTYKEIERQKDEVSLAAVVISHRVKVLIPEALLWASDTPKNVTRSILGAKVEYVIKKIDRENNVCIASRIDAVKIKRRLFFRKKPKIGDYVDCAVLAVGRTNLLIEAGGFDLRLNYNDLRYNLGGDLREYYNPGQTISAVITKVDSKENVLNVSVRDAKPHPYIGIEKRHPVNSRRASVITGKYKGLVFCKLEDDFDCLCNFSVYQGGDDFKIGDKVIICIKEYNDERKRVFATIISKWN